MGGHGGRALPPYAVSTTGSHRTLDNTEMETIKASKALPSDRQCPLSCLCIITESITQDHIVLFCEAFIQWGKKVFSQPPIVQVLPLKNIIIGTLQL